MHDFVDVVESEDFREVFGFVVQEVREVQEVHDEGVVGGAGAEVEVLGGDEVVEEHAV